MLRSRRGSAEFGQHHLVRQRSKHSLIVESINRILDDSALEQRLDREMLGVDYKTSPPSEVHFGLHDQFTGLNASLAEFDL